MLTTTVMKQTLLSSSSIPQIEYQTDPKFKKGRKGRAKQELRINWKYFRQGGQGEKTKGEVGL